MAARSHASATYRFGFNGQEKDDEIGGEGNAYSYEYRIHDTRIGRFLSLDPMYKEFPWNSPYVFCENRVISAIEVEGLEAEDLNSGEAKTEFEDQNKLGKNDDKITEPWKDLINFKPSNELLTTTEDRFSIFSLQDISKAQSDRLNLDYYSVEITDMGKLTPEDMLRLVRLNFGTLVSKSPNCDFSAYDDDEAAIWKQGNPEGSVMHFDMYSDLGYGISYNIDDGSVLTSKMDNDYWVFSPVRTTDDGYHPVAGNRQFGFIQKSNGNYVFYCRGADRPYDLLVTTNTDLAFKNADKLWRSVMSQIVQLVKNNDGDAKVGICFSKQVSWDENFGK